ncbi:glycoside hydrolase family 76 protein [Corynebacterium otitidis]|uniref:Glycoside hydrolase family 76 n=1 Tax=Corynebacterium otitidis ATCC 51513 TaxID=883169 RepID=K0YQ58_9CORY|nr:glycoside hydrolase family 76 protein [Corynebacterium otitidis]EJZ81659.1 hypothetical protein HMPREF9719_01390 [Corynebacterium otitidis ATCC 51513]
MDEKWSHRADLAEAAVTDRHARKLWGLPRTNLAVVAWPANLKELLFLRWHCWWQAHYLDCVVDAYERRGTAARRRRIRETIRGVRTRHIRPLTTLRDYDDKAWLALALGRAAEHVKPHRRGLEALREDVAGGIDELAGALPWRAGQTYYNVPANGPAAIMLARTGRLDEARLITDWIIDRLRNDDGLIMDGLRRNMHGSELAKGVHPSNQGTTLGACVEITLALREKAGFARDRRIRGYADAERADESMPYITTARSLVHAISAEMADATGVIDWETGEGDGGLFKGILARYLADAAVRLPADNPANRSAKQLAAKLVRRSAESVWSHRLEVDGLPVFPSDWTEDARLPHNFGLGPRSIAESAGMIRITERDLSIQLSGWLLLEAAARVEAWAASQEPSPA